MAKSNKKIESERRRKSSTTMFTKLRMTHRAVLHVPDWTPELGGRVDGDGDVPLRLPELWRAAPVVLGHERGVAAGAGAGAEHGCRLLLLLLL